MAFLHREDARWRLLPRVQTVVQVYRCPVHGLIESPRLFALYEPDEPAEMICPINLSTDESGITDDLCNEVCRGPFSVTV